MVESKINIINSNFFANMTSINATWTNINYDSNKVMSMVGLIVYI